MKMEISKKNPFPKKELKFLKKIRNIRIIAAISCSILALVGAYLLYSMEYEFSSDKGVLSVAIMEYASFAEHPVDACVLETKEVDGVLIAFFKDSSRSDVYGFARLLKGINQKYRLVNVNYRPGNYLAVVEPYEVTIGKETYYFVGGYNCDDTIASYGLNFVDEAFYNGAMQHETVIVKFDVKNIQFLDVHSKHDINTVLQERNTDTEEWFLNRFGTVLLNSEGEDITENYRLPEGSSNWSAGIGKAELFMLYVFIGIVLVLGIMFARYFLNEKQPE